MADYIIFGIVAALFIAVVAFRIRKKIIRRRQMKNGCGSACGSCSGCH